jgi:hypothetical protein
MGRRRIFPRILTSPIERQQPGRAKLREVAHAEQVLADLERAYSRAYLPEQFAIRIGVKKLLERWQNGEADRDPTWRQIMRERAKEKSLINGDSRPSRRGRDRA